MTNGTPSGHPAANADPTEDALSYGAQTGIKDAVTAYVALSLALCASVWLICLLAYVALTGWDARWWGYLIAGLIFVALNSHKRFSHCLPLAQIYIALLLCLALLITWHSDEAMMVAVPMAVAGLLLYLFYGVAVASAGLVVVSLGKAWLALVFLGWAGTEVLIAAFFELLCTVVLVVSAHVVIGFAQAWDARSNEAIAQTARTDVERQALLSLLVSEINEPVQNLRHLLSADSLNDRELRALRRGIGEVLSRLENLNSVAEFNRTLGGYTQEVDLDEWIKDATTQIQHTLTRSGIAFHQHLTFSAFARYQVDLRRLGAALHHPLYAALLDQLSIHSVDLQAHVVRNSDEDHRLVVVVTLSVSSGSQETLRATLQPSLLPPSDTTLFINALQEIGRGLNDVGGELTLPAAADGELRYRLNYPVRPGILMDGSGSPAVVQRHYTGLQRLLLVEDDALQRRAAKRFLTNHLGVEVDVAGSGAEALATLNNEIVPDLIVADFYLPDINGIDLLARFANQWPDLPVVVLTANQDPESHERLLAAGARAVLIKPISSESLYSVLENVEFDRPV